MIRNARVLKHTVMPEIPLTDIGHINVICGKNNSGKSTLIGAIARDEKRLTGLRPGELLDELYLVIKSQTNITGLQEARPECFVLKRTISQVLEQEATWYSDELPKLMRILEPLCRSSDMPLQGINTFVPNLNGHYEKLFESRFSTVLLPAERGLDYKPEQGANAKVSPDGRGLINYLFVSKNQPHDTDRNKLYHLINQTLKEVSLGYSFDLFLDSGNRVSLQFANDQKYWVDSHDCGLGLQHVLIQLFFILDVDHQLVLIEEPETHVHADMQRRLLSVMRDQKSKQFFLTSHSNVFLDNTFVDKVFFTRFDTEINVDDATERTAILSDLGYSVVDNLVSDLVILVEGPSDIGAIEEFLEKKGLLPKFQIKLWPLGGDTMDQHDLTVFTEKYKIMAIVDSDPGSGKVRRRFVEKCRKAKVPVTHLKGYSIENYFTVDALRHVFGAQIPAEIAEIKADEPLEKQIGINVKKRNRNVARAMALSDIADTDLGQFIEKVSRLLA